MPDLITLIGGGVIGVLAALSTRLLDHYLKKDYERARAIWTARLDKCLELERDAGFLVERLGGHARLESDMVELEAAVRRFEMNGGLVRRDAKLTQAIRDFAHQCKIIISEKGMFDRGRERLKELDELRSQFQNFLSELDRFLGTIGKEKRGGYSNSRLHPT